MTRAIEAVHREKEPVSRCTACLSREINVTKRVREAFSRGNAS